MVPLFTAFEEISLFDEQDFRTDRCTCYFLSSELMVPPSVILQS